jgi:polyhydroxybutyrate depolymerase
MKKITFLISLVFLVTGLPTFAQDNDPERSFEIFVPDDAPADESLPLLIALHGAGGDGAGMERLTGFSDIAVEEGFIAVYPDGIAGRWDFGGGIQTQSGLIHVDDVSFITGLIDEADALHPVDRGRVFLTGFSDGATMTYVLGCTMPNIFTAIAPVSAPLAMPIAETCDTPPLSFLLIHGSADPILRWDRYVAQNGQVIALSAPESAAYWMGHNNCNPDNLELAEAPDLDTEDDSVVRIVEATECENDTAVIFYGIEGGGHTWPGHPFDAVPFELGPTNMDIDASSVIWEWFAERPSIAVD